MSATLTGTPTTNSGSSATPSVSLPASPTNGDLLVVLITHNDGTVTVADNNGATAMTEDYDSGNDAGGMGVAVYTRVLTGSEPATLNFTLSTTNRWAITAFMVTGQPPSSYYDVAISSYNYEIGDTTPDFTGCTTSTDGALVILFGGIDSSSTTWTGGPGGSFVEIATVNTQQPLIAYYLEQATAGVVSNAACSISAGSNSLCMNMFAFKASSIVVKDIIHSGMIPFAR